MLSDKKFKQLMELEYWQEVKRLCEIPYLNLFKQNKGKNADEMDKLYRSLDNELDEIMKRIKREITHDYHVTIETMRENEAKASHYQQREKEDAIIESGGTIYYRVYYTLTPANEKGFGDSTPTIEEYGIRTSFSDAVALARSSYETDEIMNFDWNGEKYRWVDRTAQWCSRVVSIVIADIVKGED